MRRARARPAPRRARARLSPRASAAGHRTAAIASLWAGGYGAARVGGIVAELRAPGQGRESAMAAAVAAASGARAAAM